MPSIAVRAAEFVSCVERLSHRGAS
jgi:hypothetical protein